MSALTTTPAAAGPALKVTQGRVVRSEFTKFRSLRSTAYTLLTAVVLMVGLGAVFSAVTASQYHTFNAAARASFNPITTSLSGVMFAVVAFGVLGVLVTSGEYSTGMIRSSLTAVPRRLPVLWGKLAVFAGVIFPVSLIASFISFFLGQVLLNSHHIGVSISAPGALRSVVGAALYITVAGMIKDGQLRPLCVSAAQRLKSIPDIPGAEEAGIPGLDLKNWWSVHVPAKTPRAICDTLESWFNAIAVEPDTLKFLKDNGSDPLPGTATSLRELLIRDTANWKEYARIAHINPI